MLVSLLLLLFTSLEDGGGCEVREGEGDSEVDEEDEDDDEDEVEEEGKKK